jgi:hypothetical protein
MAQLLSVVMPVYNGAWYVGEAIESVLRQTLRDFEFLIVDDGSTDETPQILRHYAAQDARIRLFLRQRQGQIAVRNELLQLARCDLMACADADDVCLPDRLERQYNAIARDDGLWVLGTGIISMDAGGGHRRTWRMPTGSAAVSAELESRCCIAHPSCMMRTKHIRSIGGYRPAYECAEDYDLFLRASERGKVDNLASVGVLYRTHEDNVSHRNIVRQALSADLARATHVLRVGGHADPTACLTGPPELEDAIVAALIPPSRAERHRMLAAALDPDAGGADVEAAVRYLLRAPVGKKDARVFQRAMLRLTSRRSWDRFSARLTVRAAMLGPGRLARLAWSLRKATRAPAAAPSRPSQDPRPQHQSEP